MKRNYETCLLDLSARAAVAAARYEAATLCLFSDRRIEY